MTITKEIIQKEEFYTCKYDVMFKTTFIDEKRPQLIEALLSCILEGDVHVVSWPPTFLPNTTVKEKAKTRDLVVELDGKYINVEVETGRGPVPRSQLFTYHASMWKQNILRGEKYDTKRLFLQIVLQFNLSDDGPFIKEYKMQSIDEETKKVTVWVENFKTFEINMARVMKLWYDGSREDIDKYAYLMMLDMNEENLKNLKDIRKGDEIVMEYADKVCGLNNNPNFINTIGKEKEREYMFNTAVDLAREEGIEQGLEKGIEQGIEKGIEQGLEKGIEQGLEKGIEQGLEKGIEQGLEKGIEQGIEKGKIQIIKAIHSSGMTPEEIAAICKLTQDEVDNILDGQSS